MLGPWIEEHREKYGCCFSDMTDYIRCWPDFVLWVYGESESLLVVVVLLLNPS